MSPEYGRLLLLTEGHHEGGLDHALQMHCDLVVVKAEDPQSCLSLLRQESFDLLAIEDCFMTADSTEQAAIYEAAGDAMILELNFAIAHQDRILRQVQSALRRKRRLEQRARDVAARGLRDELGGTIAGLLLEAQLLTKQDAGPLTDSLRSLAALAETLSSKLRIGDEVATEQNCIP